MNIIVLVKIVDGELNIFDRSALESALCVENSEITVLCMGPESAKEKLRSLTRLGAKRVILLSDKNYAGSDTLATSYILSCAIKKLFYDYIFCGVKTTDGDTGQVGSCLATILGINLITNVMETESIRSFAKCRTRMGEQCEKSPALLTFERINTLRFPSIRSKESDIEVWDNSVLNADLSRCGLNGSPTRVLEVFERESDKRHCTFLDAEDLLPLIEKLKKESKECLKKPESRFKLKSVWVIGKEVYEKAKEIADEVIVIDNKNPFEIAKLAAEQKPDYILWNADLWGRKNAPVVSAILKTGLCADCTLLETDGTKLYMYRPAKSGNVTAKIECSTRPVMATVRTTALSDDIIVSAGKGTAEFTDLIKNFAEKINAELCASRGLVDSGIAPYSAQVGLTGKSVSPKIYIAVGISGAVHHIAGIENSDYIIAVNTDKKARIFDYADYGIVCDARRLQGL